jgi:hypothetical protein
MSKKKVGEVGEFHWRERFLQIVLSVMTYLFTEKMLALSLLGVYNYRSNLFPNLPLPLQLCT